MTRRDWMSLKTKRVKDNSACEIHGSRHKTANKTLLFMILASLSLIIWHVWVYGPTVQTTNPDLLRRPFPVLLGSEIWDLLFNRRGMIAELWSVFPYFIVGILLAGYIRTYKIAAKLQTTLIRYGFLSVFLASLVGILTPLCACGTDNDSGEPFVRRSAPGSGYVPSCDFPANEPFNLSANPERPGTGMDGNQNYCCILNGYIRRSCYPSAQK